MVKLNRTGANHLNCMGYQVETEDGHYYITSGILGLYRYARRHSLDYKAFLIDILLNGQVVVDDENIITMI